MKLYLVTLFALLLFIVSCNKNGNKKISDKPIFNQTPLDSAYATVRPQIQTFTINNTKTNTIEAKNGTKVFIPANCFIDGNGNTVSKNVTVEIVEALSLKDFITSGLATVSTNKLLISNGMMYINARVDDTKLQLDKGISLSVSMPTINDAGGFNMFNGDGNNWIVDSTMLELDYEITLPLNLLYPEGNKYIWHCIQVADSRKEDKYAYYDTTIVSFTNPKYENTVIATYEFQRRVYLLQSMTQRMSYFTNSDYYFDKVDCFGQKDNNDLFKVYFDHPNRSFRESDSIAKKMYLDYFKVNESKIASFCDEVNKHKRKYYSNWTDTNYHFDFRKISLKDDYMNVLEYFPPKNTKEIKRINDYGINLNESNAFDLLKKKGLDIKEINELLTYNFRRQAIVKMLQNQKEAINDKEKLAKFYESTLFSVSTMGWINCDKFYDDPSAGKAEIYVKNESKNNLKFIDCSLVIPEMNVRLSAFQENIDKYTFTQKNGPYTNLPIGKPAVIIGIAIQNDSIFFASKKIKIKDGISLNLPMKYIKNKDLNDSINAALKIKS